MQEVFIGREKELADLAEPIPMVLNARQCRTTILGKNLKSGSIEDWERVPRTKSAETMA